MNRQLILGFFCFFVAQLTRSMEERSQIVISNNNNNDDSDSKVIKEYFRASANPSLDDFLQKINYNVKKLKKLEKKYNKIGEAYRSNFQDYIKCAAYDVFNEGNRFLDEKVIFSRVAQVRSTKHLCIKRSGNGLVSVECCSSLSIEQRMQENNILKIIVTSDLLRSNQSFLKKYINYAVDNQYMLEDDNHNSFLHLVAKNNEIELVRSLVFRSVVDINSKNKSGETPLVCAVANDNLEMCQLFLEQGADPDSCDLNKMTVFHKACVSYIKNKKINPSRTKKCDIMELLLKHKADPNRSNDLGITPMMRAAFNEDIDLYRLLIRYEVNRDFTIQDCSDETLRQIIVCCVESDELPSIEKMRQLYLDAELFASFGAQREKIFKKYNQEISSVFSIYVPADMQIKFLQKCIDRIKNPLPSSQNQ